MIPPKLTDVGTDDAIIEPYLVDPNWIMQQKHDGARMVVIYEDGTLRYLNGMGNPMTFSAAVLKIDALSAELSRLIAAHEIVELILDGEIIIETGVYHVFDLVKIVTNDHEGVTPEWPLRARLAELTLLLDPLLSLHGTPTLAELAVTARSEDEKRRLWASVRDAGVEGAISKHLESRWEGVAPGGRQLRTKEWVKHKLVKTADVVVTAVDRTFKADGVTLSHGKAELAVPIARPDDPQPWLDAKGKRRTSGELSAMEDLKKKSARELGFTYVPRDLLPVGNASLIGRELTIQPGSVVEVNYLYWTGDALVQPRIVRQRFDKTAEQCDLSQFPAYTRAVVQLDPSEGRVFPAAVIEAAVAASGSNPASRREPASAPAEVFDGPRTGRGPSGKLRNFDAMGDAKFAAEAAKIESENNDPEALEAVRASRTSRAVNL